MTTRRRVLLVASALLAACCTISSLADLLNPRSSDPYEQELNTAIAVALTDAHFTPLAPVTSDTRSVSATPNPQTNTPASTPNPGREEATVTRVIDGDTIEVSIAGETYPLRYTGIDAPEPGQPFGPEATDGNRRLVEGMRVTLEIDQNATDRHGRLLRYVYLPDGTFVNAELVRLGFAAAARYPPDTRYAALFDEMEQEAAQAARGIWVLRLGTGHEPCLTPADFARTGPVQISEICADGTVSSLEPDEYAVITNVSTEPVDITGWRLNGGDKGQDFTFPEHVLQPGESCRVYTNEHHPGTCGFSFGMRALWNNGGDCGCLFDAGGRLVDVNCYSKGRSCP